MMLINLTKPSEKILSFNPTNWLVVFVKSSYYFVVSVVELSSHSLDLVNFVLVSHMLVFVDFIEVNRIEVSVLPQLLLANPVDTGLVLNNIILQQILLFTNENEDDIIDYGSMSDSKDKLSILMALTITFFKECCYYI